MVMLGRGGCVLLLEVDFGSFDDSHCSSMAIAMITICTTFFYPRTPSYSYRFRYRYFAVLAIFFDLVRYIIEYVRPRGCFQ